MNKHGKRSILIFGGAGFIGSNLACSLLTQTDAKVHVFDNFSRAGVRHNVEWLREIAGEAGRLQITAGDVRDRRQVEKAVAQASEIYHLAAQVAVTAAVADPRSDFEINLAGTFNVLDAARRSRNQPFVLFTSTNKVYGELKTGTPVISGKRYRVQEQDAVTENQPLDFHSPYGCSKGAADQYVRDFARIYGLPAVVFRMSCVAGPRQFGTEDQGWVAHFVYSALQGKPVTIYGDGRQVRDVLCIDDLIRAFAGACENAQTTRAQIYNVGGGLSNATSLLELADKIELLTGRRLKCVFERSRPGDQLAYVTDNSKLRRDTGWQPRLRLTETILQLQHFWEENQELLSGPPVETAAEASSFALAAELSGRAG